MPQYVKKNRKELKIMQNIYTIKSRLAELREEGKLKEISEKYLGGDYTESAYQ